MKVLSSNSINIPITFLIRTDLLSSFFFSISQLWENSFNISSLSIIFLIFKAVKYDNL